MKNWRTCESFGTREIDARAPNISVKKIKFWPRVLVAKSEPQAEGSIFKFSCWFLMGPFTTIPWNPIAPSENRAWVN